MLKIRTSQILAVFLAVATMTTVALVPVSAQTLAPPVQDNTLTLPDGTEFNVVTTEDLTSKTATEGDPITLKVADDVKINEVTVIAKDTIVKGVVSAAKKAGMMGRGGNLGIRIESVATVDGQKLKLRSSKGKEGDDATGTTVALVVLFGPLGFLKHGKQATIKAGTSVKVFSDEEKHVSVVPRTAAVQ
jgi:hypothetical protein